MLCVVLTNPQTWIFFMLEIGGIPEHQRTLQNIRKTTLKSSTTVPQY